MTRIITKIDQIRVPYVKRHVAAYCRISSERETQKISLKNQIEHYEYMIASREDWEFAGIYYDEGLSGTKQESRPELQRLLADCRAGKIDLIVTKSISRLARNTVDCLEIVRQLTDLGVHIYFEKENLSTESCESELIMTILASLAEEESHSISENNKWAVQKKFQHGTFRLSRAPYGYDLEDGRLVINPEEAGIVRYIFECILNGRGTPDIAKELNERGVPTKRGGRWHAGTLQNMTKNVIFKGDLLMQKTYRNEHFDPVRNNGEFAQYYIEDHHEAIVSKEVFDAAAQQRRQRGKEKNTFPCEDPGRHEDPHHRRYCFTGKIICGHCGSCFRRQVTHGEGGEKVFWSCRKHLSDITQCPMGRVRETALKQAFLTMLNKLAYSRRFLLLPYMNAIEQYDAEVHNGRMREVIKEKEELSEQKRLLKMRYSQGKVSQPAFREELSQLKAAEQILAVEKRSLVRHDEHSARAAEFNRFLLQWDTENPEFSEEVFLEVVDHIVVCNKDQIKFYLKCALELSEGLIK